MHKDLLALLGFSRIEEFDPRAFWEGVVPGGPIKVPVASTDDGSPVRVDLGRFSGTGDHVLVVGDPQSGTTMLLKTVMICLAALRPPEQLGFLAIEARSEVKSFDGIERTPHCSGVVNPRHGAAGTATRVSQWLMGEIERRRELFVESGVTNISDYQVNSIAARAAGAEVPVLPELFVVIEDVTWLVDSEFDVISRILRAEGHSLGVRLIVGTPYVTWAQLKDSGYFDQITPRFTLGLDSAQSSAVFDATVSDDLELEGQAYVRSDDGELLRCQLISADEPYRRR